MQKTFADNLLNLKKEFFSFLCDKSRVEIFFLLFWLSGPFILLWERSAADAWITIIALAFLVRSSVKKDWLWFGTGWVLAVSLFWGWCVITSFFSTMPEMAFREAIIWVRFPVFAAACAFWLGKDKIMVKTMFYSIALGVVLMCLILLAELYSTGYVRNARLTWPYGDHVSGNYLAKVGLPVSTALIAIATSRSRHGNWAFLFSLVTLPFSILTGERANLILKLCAGGLASLIWKPVLSRIIVACVSLLTAFFVLVSVSDKLMVRFSSESLPSLVDGIEKLPWVKAAMTGWAGFIAEPIFGVGVGNLRYLCPELTKQMTNVECHNHPHNFYTQILGETGLIGLTLAVIFFAILVFHCYNDRKQSEFHVLSRTAFVIPLAIFWPLQPNADFFGQWNNCFIWSAIGYSLCCARAKKEAKK